MWHKHATRLSFQGFRRHTATRMDHFESKAARESVVLLNILSANQRLLTLVKRLSFHDYNMGWRGGQTVSGSRRHLWHRLCTRVLYPSLNELSSIVIPSQRLQPPLDASCHWHDLCCTRPKSPSCEDKQQGRRIDYRARRLNLRGGRGILGDACHDAMRVLESVTVEDARKRTATCLCTVFTHGRCKLDAPYECYGAVCQI